MQYSRKIEHLGSGMLNAQLHIRNIIGQMNVHGVERLDILNILSMYKE